MSTFKEKNEDDLLSVVYLVKKKIGKDSLTFRTLYEDYFLMEKNIVLEYPRDEKDTTFSIFNLVYKNSAKSPFQEIFINPEKAEIDFFSIENGERNLRFLAKFDEIEKNWDVRSYLGVVNQPSSLKKVLDNLALSSEYGLDESNSFIEMIMAANNIFENKEERKLSNK